MSDNRFNARIWPHRNRNAVPPPFITPPPPQSSPQHMLNALNDKCIQHILGYLIGGVEDFLSAAEVCEKFQENAKQCYSSIYTDFEISSRHNQEYHLTLHRVKDYLKIFGHLIKSK